MKQISIFAFVCATCVSACNQQAPRIGPDVEERAATEIGGCQYLGTVQGIPKVFGPLKSLGQEDAERVAKRKAQQAGANTVVFDPIDAEAEVFQVTGRAYAC